jgi:hypothetical protein
MTNGNITMFPKKPRSTPFPIVRKKLSSYAKNTEFVMFPINTIATQLKREMKNNEK